MVAVDTKQATWNSNIDTKQEWRNMKLLLGIVLLVYVLAGVYSEENHFIAHVDLGIYPWMADAEDKIRSYASILNQRSPDFLCVSGLYSDAIKARFKKEMESSYEAGRIFTGTKAFSRCYCDNNAQTIAFEQCLNTSGCNTTGSCSMATCAPAFHAMDRVCKSCISERVPITTPGVNYYVALKQCQLEVSRNASQCLLSNGDSGLMLLSRLTPSNTGTKALDGKYIHREVIYNQYPLSNGLIHVFCSQFDGPFMNTFAFNGELNNTFLAWETKRQSVAALSYATSFGEGSVVKSIMLGDVQSNPPLLVNGQNITALNDEAYGLFDGNSFKNPFIQNEGITRCLFCGSINYIPNHIFYRALADTAYMTAQRFDVVKDGVRYGLYGSFLVNDPDDSAASPLHSVFSSLF